tara:strand:- start:145 stop:462 length:318 start_codon:yes stop_codon:yes gene_type:complete
MSIVGTILGIIAIGLVFWLRKDQKTHFDLHDGDIYAARHAYEALMSDFNNYQVNTDRQIADLKKQIEIKTNNAERRMDKMNKSLPSVIGQVVGQIEFAQDKITRK